MTLLNTFNHTSIEKARRKLKVVGFVFVLVAVPNLICLNFGGVDWLGFESYLCSQFAVVVRYCNLYF